VVVDEAVEGREEGGEMEGKGLEDGRRRARGGRSLLVDHAGNVLVGGEFLSVFWWTISAGRFVWGGGLLTIKGRSWLEEGRREGRRRTPKEYWQKTLEREV